MPFVDTVTGPRDTSALGQVLMHEHMVVLTLEVCADYPELSWRGEREARLAEVAAKLRAAKLAGIDTVVDLTVLGLGRSIAALQQLAAEVDVNLVVATGIYTYDFLSFFYVHRAPEPGGRDVLTDMFVKDITEGIGDSGVKAAILKCCTDRPGVTANIERILRATARAQLETGVPISTHSDASLRTGLEQQKIFREEGVDLTRVVIGHSGDTTDLDYLKQLMDVGSTIGCDRFGIYRAETLSFDQRVWVVAELVTAGYADRIVLSHDSMCHDDVRPIGFNNTTPYRELTHVPQDVLPALLERGVTPEQIHQMMVENPVRLLPKSHPTESVRR